MIARNTLPSAVPFAASALRGLLLAALLLAPLQACGGDKAADSADAAGASEADSSAEVAHPEDAASGSITVTNAIPASGNGEVKVATRFITRIPGRPTAMAIEGSAGEITHSLLIVFDSVGKLSGINHTWKNADESIHVLNACAPCSETQVTVDEKTGEVTLRGLVFAKAEGTDMVTGNTGTTSTLTGHVLP